MVGEKCIKLIQFATLFHILKHGKPMFEYEAHKELFDFLYLEENLKIHWTNLASWAMTQHMHNMVLEATFSTITIT
jgi:hypothetical protein